MKTTSRTTKGIAIAVMALALASASFAQQADKPPVPGTYYSAKDFEWKPPLPFNPHPELPVVEIEPGKFLVDDTGVPDTPEQAEARKRWQEADALAKLIAADPILAAAARQEAEEAARKVQDALTKKIQEEFVPWLHADAKLPDGTRATFQQQAQQHTAAIGAEIARLKDYNAAELQAGLEQAAAIGLQDLGTNQAGGVLSLVGTGHGLGFITSFNAKSADTISTDEIQPGGGTGLGLTGTNTVIGVWEAGRVFTNHLEFTNGARRVFELETTNRYSVTDHATHVTGTLIAGGITNTARGMAFQAVARTWDADGDTAEMLSEASTQGVRLSNHSYGRACGWAGVVFVNGVPFYYWAGDIAISTTQDYRYGFYDAVSANIDSSVYLAKHYLPVWAAGNERGPQGQAPSTNAFTHVTLQNDQFVFYNGAHPHDYTPRGGYDLLPPQQCSKNGLTVGAVSNIVGGYSGSNSVAMSTFSSFGPTDDGRIKPDLVAGGVNIFSTGSASNTHYYTDSGTSMAAPAVAGSLNLLVGRHNALYGTNQPLLASTLRGLAIHTADEAGPTAGPDYRFGWGLFNARNAALLMESNHASQVLAHIKAVRLLSGDYIEFPIVATNNRPLRVGIYWTDPPGTPVSPSLNPTNRMLVNDLDLRVISPNGTTNLPWVLSSAAVTNAATLADNMRDNVERVDLPVPANGTHIVRVTHKGNLVNHSNVVSEQWVSILISGNLPQPQPELVIEPPVLNGTNALLKWPSVVGRIYRVDYNDDLTTSTWTDATGEISATKTNVTVTVPASSDQRFYRVVQVR